MANAVGNDTRQRDCHAHHDDEMGHVLAGIEPAIGVVVDREGVDTEIDADAYDDHQQADGDDGWDAAQPAGGVPECVYR